MLLLVMLYTQYSHALDASVNHAQFQTPDHSFIELYFHIVGQTATFVPQNKDSILYEAKIQVITIFRKNDEIVKYDKYNLNSPATDIYIDFIDLKRYVLDNGEYDIEVALQDLNNIGNAKTFNFKTTLDFQNETLAQSDIQLLQAFTKKENSNHPCVKNGFLLETLPFSFYAKNNHKLIFYHEVYGTDQFIDDDFLIRYSILSANNNGQGKEFLVMNKKKKPASVVPMILQMDIAQIPSGNYLLRVEIKNRDNELLSSKETFFQRSNPITALNATELTETNIDNKIIAKLDEDQLRYSLKAIAPVIASTQTDILNEVIKSKNTTFMKRFLANYWFDQHPQNPEFAYEKFMEVARAVDELYKSGFGYGFETDRGNIFMRYGKPDQIFRNDTETDAPPYEFWTYNSVPNSTQTNVKFVFYNPTLAPGDFVLLHSNARGEINNPNWQTELYRGRIPTQLNDNHLDADGVIDNFNRNADRWFGDF